MKREKDKRMMAKIVSISLGLGEAQGAWKQHPSNFLTKKLFLIANPALVSILGSGKLHFVLLVVSTAIIFSSVSNQVSEYFYSQIFSHVCCPHHT